MAMNESFRRLGQACSSTEESGPRGRHESDPTQAVPSQDPALRCSAPLRGCREHTATAEPSSSQLNTPLVSDPVHLPNKAGSQQGHAAATEPNSPGILQSWKISSEVFDPRIPSLSSFWAVLKPGIPCRAQTVTTHVTSQFSQTKLNH